jgi:hypothetical protein
MVAYVPVVSCPKMVKLSDDNEQKRRKEQMGNDQVVYETIKSKSDIGTQIAALFDNYYYNEQIGSIWWKSSSKFHWVFAFVTWLICMGIALLYIQSMLCGGELLSRCDPTYSMEYIALVISTIIGIIVGIFAPRDENEIDYIRLSDINSGKKTRVLIKIYNDSGRRNIDDDKLMEIRDLIGNEMKSI